GELPGFDADAFQHVVDELREAHRAALQRQHELADLPGLELVEAIPQQLDRGELCGEGGAELVRDVGEDGIARAPDGLELRLVANDLYLQAFVHPGARDDRSSRAL